jgi:cytochrome c oxidase subunit 2
VGRTAIIIGVAYIAAATLAGLLVLAIGFSTRVRGEPDTTRLAAREKTWFVVAVALLTALLFATIFFTPYGRSASPGAQVVRVEARQFFWKIPPTPIDANRQVEFRITSKDVSHEFAVYTTSWKLLFQVQVLPGKEQRYVYTFHTPGRYRVVCLEYCGVGHADMLGQLQVVA